MTRGKSLDDIIERRRRERDDDGERFVDLALKLELDGQELLRVGGRWDRRLDDFDGQAETGVIVRIHPGQRAAVEWFSTWLAAHAERRERPPEISDAELEDLAVELDTDPAHVYAALLAGGRRAGKTWIGVALAVAYAIAFPGAIVWLVSSADTKHDEIRRYVAGVVAREWVDHETEADGWELCNGSRLMLKSAYDPEALKEGEVNFAFLNEGQKVKRRAYTLLRGAIIDHAGLVLVAANPPVEEKDEQWVADFAAEAQAGKRAALYFHFDPRRNPHIDRRALLAMLAELDERTGAIEVLGEFRAALGAVAYNWNRLENERAVPRELADADVTEMFLSSIEEGDGIRQVVGLDVQRVPYIGGPIFRFFGTPDRDRVLAWIVGEVVLDGGDEVDFCGALLDAGLDPSETLIVCDASGRYQHSRRRSTDAPPPEWKGRGSFDLIRGEGFTRIVPPDRRQKRNPEIVDRVRAFTSLIATKAGVRRLFCDPDKAPRTAEAIREWKTTHGAVSRAQKVAHLGDATSYVAIRLFPRRVVDVDLTKPERSQNPRPAMAGPATQRSATSQHPLQRAPAPSAPSAPTRHPLQRAPIADVISPRSRPADRRGRWP